MGLATLGKDRFAGLSGTGSFTTRNVTIAGGSLLVTADVEAGGSVSVGLQVDGYGPADTTAFTTSVTDAPVVFHQLHLGGKTDDLTLARFQGRSMAMVVELKQATLYTIGFGPSPPAPEKRAKKKSNEKLVIAIASVMAVAAIVAANLIFLRRRRQVGRKGHRLSDALYTEVEENSKAVELSMSRE